MTLLLLSCVCLTSEPSGTLIPGLTFNVEFDEVVKRHRSGTHWVYQRREPAPAGATPVSPSRPSREPQPIIHVSAPDNESPATIPREPGHDVTPRRVIRGKSPSRMRKSSLANLAGPRRFHLSRASLAPEASQQVTGGGAKRSRAEPSVFVERSRRKMPHEPVLQGTANPTSQAEAGLQQEGSQGLPQERPLKKPGLAKKNRSQQPEGEAHFPLPASFTQRETENLDQITADMNQWVMNELGANLQAMDEERRHVEKPRFKPRAPSKRYQDRHPDISPSKQPRQSSGQMDTPMGEISDEEGDDEDWIIDEYIRVPADSMAVDVAPTDVGFIVLEGDEENTLFFGPERDDEDEYLEDEDDENGMLACNTHGVHHCLRPIHRYMVGEEDEDEAANPHSVAENHYTADYPEDEVDTDDEFDRHPYLFRNENASDEEEFDNRYFDENNDDEMVLEGDDDDATMARIRTYMRRNAAFR
ncbi:hypothetical protein HJFPF1_02961 [Paramyrothecium foliicola]|nr:hypothetical protein HJFPF1_02961 [Paramyrothecium foliicola]